MKTRTIYGSAMVLTLAAAVGIWTAPGRTAPAVTSSSQARAEVAPTAPSQGFAHLSTPLNSTTAAYESLSTPTIVDIKTELDHLSDDELKRFAARATERVRKMLASDPTGRSRSVTDTEKLGLALNQESAARLILIDRSIEAARKKYL